MKWSSLATLVCALVNDPHDGIGEPWPTWRGPTGNGICCETNLPLRWSAHEHVRWSFPLPDRGNSTPVVWGRSVFVTQWIESRRQCVVMCFDAENGRMLWQAGPFVAETDPTHEENPPCSSSPVTDGERVIAWFGSAGVYAYDMNGHQLWHRDLGKQSHQWGYASSPVLYEDLCLLNFGPGSRSFLIALDKRTGQTVWQYELPSIRPDAKWEEFGGEAKDNNPPSTGRVSDVAGSWSTPVIVPAASGDELVLSYPLKLMAWAPRTGELLWTCAGPNIGAYSSPFHGDGLVVASVNGFTNALMAVRPGGRGDVTSSHRIWYRVFPPSKASIGSGVVHQGLIYQVTYMGFMQCIDLATGQTVWEERLAGTGPRNASWSSVVLAGTRLYVSNQNADVFVLKAGRQFQSLATNSIGGEPMNASVAVSDRAIYLRTHRRLWCIKE